MNKPYRPCAGIMLVNEEGLIFAGERHNIEDAWQMPQGGIDDGEEPLETAYRELFEETGIPKTDITLQAEYPEWLTYNFPPDILNKHKMTTKYKGQTQKWFLFKLNKNASPINLEKAEHNEFSNWKWATQEFLIKHVGTFKQENYRKVFAEFSNI